MSKREIIEPHAGDKRYARRDDKGHFTEQTDVGRSSAIDQRRQSNHKPPRGEGDKGDRQA